MRILVESGCCSLDLLVAPGTDLDGRFPAMCTDTGETLLVNGWLADSIIVAEDAEEAMDLTRPGRAPRQDDGAADQALRRTSRSAQE